MIACEITNNIIIDRCVHAGPPQLRIWIDSGEQGRDMSIRRWQAESLAYAAIAKARIALGAIDEKVLPGMKLSNGKEVLTYSHVDSTGSVIRSMAGDGSTMYEFQNDEARMTFSSTEIRAMLDGFEVSRNLPKAKKFSGNWTIVLIRYQCDPSELLVRIEKKYNSEWVVINVFAMPNPMAQYLWGTLQQRWSKEGPPPAAVVQRLKDLGVFELTPRDKIPQRSFRVKTSHENSSSGVSS